MLRVLYGCRPKPVTVGLEYGLGCAPVLSVTRGADATAICGLWHHIG